MGFGQYLGIAGTVVGAIAGGVIGYFAGGQVVQGAMIGASLGGAAGGVAGSVFFPEKPDVKSTPPPQPRENRVQVSSYGAMIPEVEGVKRFAGNILWAGPTVETVRRSRHRQDGVRYYENELIYTRTLVILFCKGPISGISRVWVDHETFVDFRDAGGAYFPPAAGELAQANIDASDKLADQYFRIYYGTEDQLPDPTYEAGVGAGRAPAFRGWCYMVFPDFPVGRFGTLPNIEAELVSGASTASENTEILLASANDLNRRGTHEFTPDGNFVGVTTTTVTDFGGWSGQQGSVQLFNKFSKQVIAAGPLILPQLGSGRSINGNSLPSYPPGYAGASRVISGWAVDPVTGQLWVGWSIYYYNSPTPSGTIVGQEMVFQVYSSPGGTLQRQWSEYSSGWSGLYSPSFYFVGDYLWIRFGIYSGGYYGHFQKRSRDGANVLKSFTRISVQAAPGGAIRSWDCGASSTDGEYFYAWADLPPYGPIRFKPDDIIITGNTGYLYESVGNFTYLENRYSGDWPVSWAGWWPPAGSSNAAYDFQAFEDRYFLSPTRWVNPSYRIYVKNPAHPDGFADSSADADGVRKRSTVAEQVANLAVVFSKYCQAAGLSESEVAATALASDSVLGYGITRQTPARTIIEPLMLPFQFDVGEIDWQLKAVKRGAASVVTIPDADLAAVPYGAQPIDRVTETREQDIELPTHLTLTYEDKNRDYDLASQNAVRVDRPHYVPMTISSPLVLTATLAKRAAEVALASYHLGRRRFKFQTGPKYIEYAPTDVVTVAGKDMRVTSVAWRDGVVEFTALAEEGGSYTSAAQAQDIGYSLPDLSRYSYIPFCLLVELPSLSPLHNNAGLYAAMYGLAASFRGGTLQRSTDGGANYSDVAYFGATPAVAGACTGVLGAGLENVLDHTAALTVDLAASGGVLASASDDELAGGANLAAVGSGNAWEILQFKTATLGSGNAYTLTGLVRGLYGTARFIGAHGQGENFIKLNGLTGIQNIGVDVAAIGSEYLYRELNPDGLSGSIKTFTSQGIGLKPYPVSAVTGTRNASGDLLISWKRGDRYEFTIPELQDYLESEPQSEAALDFEVDIIHPLSGAVVRTLAAGANESVTYTAAQIAADAYLKKRVDDGCSGSFAANFLDKSYVGSASFSGGRLRLTNTNGTNGAGANAEVNRSIARSGSLFVGFTVHPKGYVANTPFGPNDFCVMVVKSSPAYNYTWAVQAHPEIGVGNNSALSVHFFDTGAGGYQIYLYQRVSGTNTLLASIVPAVLDWHAAATSLTWKIDFANHTVSLYAGATLLVNAVAFSSSIDAQLTSNVAVVFHMDEYSSSSGIVGEFDDIKIYDASAGPFPVACDVYQKSAAIGRGLPARAYV